MISSQQRVDAASGLADRQVGMPIRTWVLLVAVLEASVLLAPAVHASPMCGEGVAVLARYSYCFFETRDVPVEDGTNQTSGAARTTTGAATAGTSATLATAVLQDAEETTTDGSSRWAVSTASFDTRLIYRTSLDVDVAFGQEDAEGVARRAIVGTVVVDDPLLRRATLGTGYHHRESGAGACENGIDARATFLSDGVGVAPMAPCLLPMPWLETRLLTVAVANTLP